MEELDNHLKEVSFNSNAKLKEKFLGHANVKPTEKENEDVFNKLWSCYRENEDNIESKISRTPNKNNDIYDNIS